MKITYFSHGLALCLMACMPSIKAINALEAKNNTERTHDNVSDRHQLILTVKKGQTLAHLLRPYQVTPKMCHRLTQEMKPFFDPRRLQVGQKVQLDLKDHKVHALRIQTRFSSVLEVSHHESSWRAKEVTLSTFTKNRYQAFRVNNSFYQTAADANVPHRIINQGILAFSHMIDFQREVYQDDLIAFYYAEQHLKQEQRIPGIHKLILSDERSRPNNLLYAEMITSNRVLRLYHFTDTQGHSAFYHQDGTLAQSFLLKTPLDGARLTSTFKKRKHPILGYTRMHKGLDFGAPIGTPIKAAGNGKVVKAAREGTFGKVVKIKHQNGYLTLYAHLNGFAKGVKAGKRVKQGETIGYLGNTGLSQVRHLHYEIHKNGRAINPLRLKKPKNARLKGKDLLNFKARITDMGMLIAQLKSEKNNS